MTNNQDRQGNRILRKESKKNKKENDQQCDLKFKFQAPLFPQGIEREILLFETSFKNSIP